MPNQAEPPGVWEHDVVLADGGTVHVRPLRASDEPGLLALYDRLSDESIYLRFFSPLPRPTAGHLEHLITADEGRKFALVAELGDDVIGIARYDRIGDDEAEVAFAIQDDQQGRGLGTILLEHLAFVARARGVARFVAEMLPQNRKMLGVFRDAGFTTTRTGGPGTFTVTLDLSQTPAAISAQRAREHTSEARSVARVLAPTSIAVIGASRTTGTIGNAVLRNLLAGDFAGPIYPVNPHARSIAGVAAFANVRDIPDRVDLAVITVPAAAVLDVARDCAAKGVAGLVVISAGFAEVDGTDELELELVAFARRNGMRIIGPNCMGIVNTHPEVRMNATFAPFRAAPGRVGFASQSGGLGIALLARAGELGLGISSFVSMGNKADVSGNDLLQYWDEDPETDVILLYLESFGNPRKFARLAREISRHTPIVAVKSGRSPAGERGTSSHTAALAAPDVAVDALFHQAGVVRVDTLDQLFGTASVLLHQPLPPGRRVAIVTNGGGPGILAADACSAAGLDVPELSEATQAQLREFVSPDAGVRNPVDLVASATAPVYERALRTVLRSGDVDAVIALFVPPLVTRPEDVAAAIVAAARDAHDTPVLACFLGRTGLLDVLDGEVVAGDDGAVDAAIARSRAVPTFAFPEAAADALGRAAAHAAWCRRPAGSAPVLERIDEARARGIVDGWLAERPDGGWVEPAAATALLASFGAPAVAAADAASADEAAEVAARLGFPVALKAASPDLVHKTDVGGVHLDLRSVDAVREAYTTMEGALGARMGGAVVQQMAKPGVETIVGITRDASFGSLVLVGMGGVTAELIRDTQLRIVPLTDVDATEMVRSMRSSPLLFGYRGAPDADVAALEDVILRVSRLAEAFPEIAELDCNPVIVSTEGAVVVDAKLRLVPATPDAPSGLRRLR